MWIFCEQRQFYILYIMPYLIVVLCVILTVQSILLLLLLHRLNFFITGMLSSRMLKLVIVVAPMADIDLQNAQNYVQQLNQHPVKKACLMLCLTLDGLVCYMKVHLRLNTLRTWHLNCLNARSQGLHNVIQLLYCVSLKICNKFANYFCELKFSGNPHQRP